MKVRVLPVMGLVFLSCFVGTSQAADVSPAPSDLCFFSGLPPADIGYTEIKKVKRAKGSYGSVINILPMLAEDARKLGADGIINYTGSQRFGFWPWRFVRPVVRGVAIKWNSSQKPDCLSVGGTHLSKILATNTPPA